jgi:hypothetical protein
VSPAGKPWFLRRLLQSSGSGASSKRLDNCDLSRLPLRRMPERVYVLRRNHAQSLREGRSGLFYRSFLRLQPAFSQQFSKTW